MKALIVEDDPVSRMFLKKILSTHGPCDVAVDGEKSIEAFNLAWKNKDPYDLICMDIMMPNIDGQEALKQIREQEQTIGVPEAEKVKIIMTTVLDDSKNMNQALQEGYATDYMTKPLDRDKIFDRLFKLGLINK